MKIVNRNAKANLILSRFVFCAMIVFLYSCGSGGGGDDSSSGTGSVSFGLALQDQGTVEALNSQAIQALNIRAAQALNSRAAVSSVGQFECQTDEYLIAKIEAQVVDENDELLAEGGPWDCDHRQGTIGDVKAGTGRIVKIFAKDESGTTLFRGQSEPLTVQVGQTAEAGTIPLYPVYPPPSPKSLIASKGQYSDNIRLTWDDIDNKDGYYIYRSLSLDGPYSRIGQTDADTTSYDDFQPCGGDPVYWYVVRAFNIAGESGDSNVDSGHTADCPIYPPVPPADLNASDGIFEDRIRLTWSDVDGEDGYHIYRSLNADGPYSQIDQTDVNTTSYDDFQPCGGDPVYWYVVRAFNIAGESEDSNKGNGYTATDCPPFAPVPPADLNASDGIFNDRVGLTWSDVDGEDGYHIFRSLNADGPYSQIGQTDADTTSYDDFQPCGGDPVYWYVVRAFNIAGESVDSNTSSGFTGECPKFTFDTDNQRWRLVGLYDDGGLDPIPNFFSDDPAPWFDLSGGEIGAGANEFNLPSSPTEDEFLHWDLNSPDLSVDSQWQMITALKYDVTGRYMSASDEIFVQAVLNVKKPDGSISYFTDFIFHPIALGEGGAWETYTLNVKALEMPPGTIILKINLRLLFIASSFIDGFIMIDNVIPLFP